MHGESELQDEVNVIRNTLQKGANELAAQNATNMGLRAEVAERKRKLEAARKRYTQVSSPAHPTEIDPTGLNRSVCPRPSRARAPVFPASSLGLVPSFRPPPHLLTLLLLTLLHVVLLAGGAAAAGGVCEPGQYGEEDERAAQHQQRGAGAAEAGHEGGVGPEGAALQAQPGALLPAHRRAGPHRRDRRRAEPEQEPHAQDLRAGRAGNGRRE
eukprot:7006753-Pyramimonas_sp.AAC.2